MRLVKPSFEIIEQESGYEGMLRHIEKCGRTCYKSEDKITEDSAKKFVDMIINRGHTAMVEHGTVYLTCESTADEYGRVILPNLKGNYSYNPYSCVKSVQVWEEPNETQKEYCRKIPKTIWYITTNYRVLLQNDWLDDLKYQCEPTEYHVKRVTVKFVCDRGVSHEFVRHRVFSFAQESTRYCNYSKDKFGNECTFIIPLWYSTLKEGQCYMLPNEDIFYNEGAHIVKRTYGEVIDYQNPPSDYYLDHVKYDNMVYNFLWGLNAAQQSYFRELSFGNIAQQARAVLPNSLKTELIMTGTIDQWKGFFELRDAKDAHPQARELAKPLHEEFIKRGYLKE